ncbi:MAG: HK97 family phage prohead protease [Sphingobium sp.]
MSAATQKSPVRFAGYAAIFNKVDRGGDIIRPGAFTGMIARLSQQAVPLLWQHRPGSPIGVIEHISEDARGLRVIGRLNAQEGATDNAALMLKQGTVRGLSFGYRVRGSQGENPRVLTDLDLMEVSLVTFPMQPSARVHAVEAQAD